MRDGGWMDGWGMGIDGKVRCEVEKKSKRKEMEDNSFWR